MNMTGNLIHTAIIETTGGREGGMARSSDGMLDVRLASPGSLRIGTTPEQLLAAGWSASFASSVAQLAENHGTPLPGVVNIRAEVDLRSSESGEPFICVRLGIHLPGLERDVAAALIERARRLCPFSRATRGNVGVVFTVV